MNHVSARLGLVNIQIGTASAVIGYGLFLVFYKSLPPEVPLWYSRPWGAAQLASPVWLLIIPSLALFASVAAGLLHRFLITSEPVLAAIISATSLVVQILAIFGLLRILLLVL